MAKSERRQAERKWRNTKLIIFKDLCRLAKHKVSKRVHTDKCKHYTERIVLASSTHRCGHIIDWVIVRPDDDIHRKSTVADSLESGHYCTKSYFNVSVSKPSTLYRNVRNIANIDRLSFIAELSSVSQFSSVEKANQFCDFLRTVLDKHAPPSLQKIITHNSSPWFESIRDELFIAKRERHQAERKWRNTNLTIFKDLYRQTKHKVSKLVSILVGWLKCRFWIQR